MSDNTKNIYSPEFIPYYIKEVKQYKLSPNEALCYWFIRFYTNTNKFFFSSKDFAKIINTTPWTVDNIIWKLVKKWIIKTNTKRITVNWVIKSIREVFLISPNSENTISSPGENTISPCSEIKREYKKELKTILSVWNEYFWVNHKMTETLYEAYYNLAKKISKEDIEYWVNRYFDWKEENKWAEYVFPLYDFLKQGNWFKRYVNM